MCEKPTLSAREKPTLSARADNVGLSEKLP